MLNLPKQQREEAKPGFMEEWNRKKKEPFRCSVCWEDKVDIGKGCKNKHPEKICKSCSIKLDTCPLCREKYL